VIGFNPYARLADYLIAEAGKAAGKDVSAQTLCGENA
jgi:hypothetical protein